MTGWTSCVVQLYMGFPVSAIGVAWPSLRGILHQPLAGLGAILFAFGVGAVLASGTVGPIAHRFGPGGLMLGGALCGTLGLLSWTLASEWPVFVLGSAGVGAMAVLNTAGISTHLSLTRGAGMLNVAFAHFAVGSSLSPAAVAWALAATGSPRPFFGACLVWQVLLMVACTVTLPRWGRLPAAASQGALTGHRRLLIIALAAIFVYLGAEQLAAQWSFSMLKARGVPAPLGAAAVASFWAAIAGGRLVAGLFARRLSAARLMAAGLATAGAGSLVLLATPAGLALIGFGLGPLYPTMVGWTLARLASRAGAVSSAQQAASYLGSGTVTAGSGLLFQMAGLDLLPVTILACLLVLAALVTIGGIGASEGLGGIRLRRADR